MTNLDEMAKYAMLGMFMRGQMFSAEIAYGYAEAMLAESAKRQVLAAHAKQSTAQKEALQARQARLNLAVLERAGIRITTGPPEVKP